MEKKLTNKIITEAEKMQREDTIMTDILIALENREYDEAEQLSRMCMSLTDNIERRIALITLIQVSENKDNKLTDGLLQMAYKDYGRSSVNDKTTRNSNRR